MCQKCEDKSELWDNSFYWTRLKCKSSARVKIVLKKDWIVKKSFQKLKNFEKNVKKKKKKNV